MIINEVYVGQTPEIKELYDEFTRVRHVYMDKFIKSPNHKDFSKIESMIEDIWGFKAFEFGVDPDKAPNAYTIPVIKNIDIDANEYLEVTPKGYRYKREAGLVAISKITYGLYCNKNFTDEETFAVFLHEIGHSFTIRSRQVADVYVGFNLTLIIVQVIILVLTRQFKSAVNTIILTNNDQKSFMIAINKALRKNPITRTITFTRETLSTFINHIYTNIIRDILTFTGFTWVYVALSNTMMPRTKKGIDKQHDYNAVGRGEERLADDFATIYGYGPALSAALIKFESKETYDSDTIMMHIGRHVPLIKNMLESIDKMSYEMKGMFDVHPNSSDRVLKILENMEHDIKSSDVSPKVKKELNEKLKEQRKLVNDLKKAEGLLAENPDKYRRIAIQLGIINGSSESDYEKDFTNQAQINKDYANNHVYIPNTESYIDNDLSLLEFDMEDFI